MFESIMSVLKNIWTILTTFPVYIFVGLSLVTCLINALSRKRRR